MTDISIVENRIDLTCVQLTSDGSYAEALPEPITLVLQTETGVQSMQKEATNEWHAVLSYDFTVSYGWKCKI